MYLFIEGSTDSTISIMEIQNWEKKILATDIDGSILSAWVVADGFVGTYVVGMYVSRAGAHVDFDWFRYEIVEE